MAKGFIIEKSTGQNQMVPGAQFVDVTVRHHFTDSDGPDTNNIDGMGKFLQGLEDCKGQTMVLTKTGARCVYCDHEVDDPGVLEKMAAHIWECDKHPLARVAKLVDLLRDRAPDTSEDHSFDARRRMVGLELVEEFVAEVARVRKGFIDCARKEDERTATDAP